MTTPPDRSPLAQRIEHPALNREVASSNLVGGSAGGSVQTLVIRGWLPPDIANASRQRHWTAIRKAAKATQTLVWASAKHAGWRYVGDDAPRMRLTVVFVFSVHRKRDQDNLVARCKHMVDGLKPFLIDDDLEHLELVVNAEVRPGVQQVELTLEPANVTSADHRPLVGKDRS